MKIRRFLFFLTLLLSGTLLLSCAVHPPGPGRGPHPVHYRDKPPHKKKAPRPPKPRHPKRKAEMPPSPPERHPRPETRGTGLPQPFESHLPGSEARLPSAAPASRPAERPDPNHPQPGSSVTKRVQGPSAPSLPVPESGKRGSETPPPPAGTFAPDGPGHPASPSPMTGEPPVPERPAADLPLPPVP